MMILPRRVCVGESLTRLNQYVCKMDGKTVNKPSSVHVYNYHSSWGGLIVALTICTPEGLCMTLLKHIAVGVKESEKRCEGK